MNIQMHHHRSGRVVFCLTIIVTLLSAIAFATGPRRPNGRSAPNADIPAELRKAEDCTELRTYITEALVDSILGSLYGNLWWDLPWSGGGWDGTEGPSDYSGTNNQEDGVDEMDIVKTNGTHLFVSRQESIAILE